MFSAALRRQCCGSLVRPQNATAQCVVRSPRAEHAHHSIWRKILRKVVLSLLLLALPAVGQVPHPAGTASLFEASAGYCYMNLDLPSTKRVNLNGLDVTLTDDFLPRFGITLDGSYARSGNLFQLGQPATVLSFLAGPVFYPAQRKRITLYTHALWGGARVSGAVNKVNGGYLVGYSSEFAWAAGGGVQYRFSPRTKLQFGADYLHTAMFGPNITTQGQNDFRAVANIVWLFGKRKDY